MKIAVPIHRGAFCPHFGGAEAFALYTIDLEDRSINDRQLGTPPEHGRGVFPSWLRKQGATVVLAGGMGPRAAEIFARQGVEVVLGVEGANPESLVRKFLDGTLKSTGQPCHDHGFHDCGSGRGHRGQRGVPSR